MLRLESLSGGGYRDQAIDLLIDPLEQGVIELDQLLTRGVGQYRTTLSFDHQIPHRRDRSLTPSLIGDLRIIGDEVKFATAMIESSLLDLMAAQVSARRVDAWHNAGGPSRALLSHQARLKGRAAVI
jgi:hypothetical protein